MDEQAWILSLGSGSKSIIMGDILNVSDDLMIQ